MPRYSTRTVLAGAYRGNAQARARVTHVLDTRLNQALCGEIDPGDLADENAWPDDAVATCPACRRRDPRAQRDANDGPRALKHLLQF